MTNIVGMGLSIVAFGLALGTLAHSHHASHVAMAERFSANLLEEYQKNPKSYAVTPLPAERLSRFIPDAVSGVMVVDKVFLADRSSVKRRINNDRASHVLCFRHPDGSVQLTRNHFHEEYRNDRREE